MNENLPRAFQAVPVEVMYHVSSWVKNLPTPEERGGAAQLVAHMWKMRDPDVAVQIAQEAEKAATRKGRE